MNILSSSRSIDKLSVSSTMELGTMVSVSLRSFSCSSHGSRTLALSNFSSVNKDRCYDLCRSEAKHPRSQRQSTPRWRPLDAAGSLAWQQLPTITAQGSFFRETIVVGPNQMNGTMSVEGLERGIQPTSSGKKSCVALLPIYIGQPGILLSFIHHVDIRLFIRDFTMLNVVVCWLVPQNWDFVASCGVVVWDLDSGPMDGSKS